MKRLVEFHNRKNTRLTLFYYIFGVLILILIGGLAWQQLIKQDDYLELEEKQSLRRIVKPAPRGEIYDREGRLLVGNRPIFSAAIYLNEIRSEFRKEYFSRVRRMRDAGLSVNRDQLNSEARLYVLNKYLEPINKILGKTYSVDSKELDRHFRQRLLLPMTVIKDISVEDYAKLTERLPVESPIQLLVDSARHYPYGSVASHTLGYVGSTGEPSQEGIPGKHLTTFSQKGKIGKNGVEKSFNSQLEGTSGGEIWVVDPRGYQYQNTLSVDPQKGQDLHLSIDLDLQIIAENSLGNHTGAVVVMDVESGEILALASKPDFDLNELTPFIPKAIYDRINQEGAWINRATQGLYPPASPFKLITAIAGMRNGVFGPEEIFYCDSGFLVGNRVFPEHNNIVFGDIDLKRALEISSNVFFYPIAIQIGPEKLAEEARRFGLGKATGIELPYETKSSVVPDPEWKKKNIHEAWWTGDTANMSIGQGYLLTTPLQMACVAASIARNETITKPTLLRSPTRTRTFHEASPIGLNKEQYDGIINGMRLCIESGSARRCKVEGLTIAAKTGTGQIRFKGVKGTVPWFLGFAPIENPKVAVAIVIEGKDPNVTLWGGTTTSPIAQAIFKNYYEKYLSNKNS